MQTPLTDNHISSRSLVLALVDTEGALRARDAFDVGEALGFTPNQIRLTLARLVDDGLLTSTGRGRHAVLLTTDRHERLHGPEPEWLASAFRQDAGHAPWDGIWRTASFTLGEDRKRERNALREVLVGMGAAALMPGFRAVQAAALRAGALACTLSGAGPAVFAIAPHAQLPAAAEQMQSAFADAGHAATARVGLLDTMGARAIDGM
jgi:DNA-binding transcriptional regulator PaaX